MFKQTTLTAATIAAALASTAPAADSPHVFTPVESGMSPKNVDGFGTIRIDSFEYLSIGEGGHVQFRSSLRDPDTLGLISGERVEWLGMAGGDAQPVFTYKQPAEGVDGDYYMGRAPFGPLPDGSAVVTMRLRDGDDPRSDKHAIYHYADGEYELLLTSGDDVPGQPGYTVAEADGSAPALAINRHGEFALRVETQDESGDTGYTWLRGNRHGMEAVNAWGDPTGIHVSDPEHPGDNREYYFHWDFIGSAHAEPAINNAGDMLFWSQAQTIHNPAHEDTPERRWFDGLWRVRADDSSPELVVRSYQPFVDQTTNQVRELENIENNSRFSHNDHGQIALRHRYSDAGGSRSELWVVDNDNSFHSIGVAQGQAAPNLHMIDRTEPANFGDVGNPSLSNTGNLSFFASVGGDWSLWITEDTNAKPIITEQMDAPGLEGFHFDRFTEAWNWSGTRAPIMNNRDQIVFFAEVTNGDGDEREGIWAYDPDAGLYLVAVEGQEIEITENVRAVGWDGNDPILEIDDEVALREITDIERMHLGEEGFMTGHGPNQGGRSPLNDAGEFVFLVTLGGEIGQIGETGLVSHEVILTTTIIPEPGVLAFVGAGGLVLLGMRPTMRKREG